MHSLFIRSLSQAASPLFYPVMLKNFPIISNAENLKTEHRRFLPDRTAMCPWASMFSTCMSICPRPRHMATVLVSSQVPPLLTHRCIWLSLTGDDTLKWGLNVTIWNTESLSVSTAWEFLFISDFLSKHGRLPGYACPRTVPSRNTSGFSCFPSVFLSHCLRLLFWHFNFLEYYQF